jgi:hypothetical protein
MGKPAHHTSGREAKTNYFVHRSQSQ